MRFFFFFLFLSYLPLCFAEPEPVVIRVELEPYQFGRLGSATVMDDVREFSEQCRQEWEEYYEYADSADHDYVDHED